MKRKIYEDILKWKKESNGKTALLNILAVLFVGFQFIIGFPSCLQITPSNPSGLSCHGMFFKFFPNIFVILNSPL